MTSLPFQSTSVSIKPKVETQVKKARRRLSESFLYCSFCLSFCFLVLPLSPVTHSLFLDQWIITWRLSVFCFSFRFVLLCLISIQRSAWICYFFSKCGMWLSKSFILCFFYASHLGRELWELSVSYLSLPTFFALSFSVLFDLSIWFYSLDVCRGKRESAQKPTPNKIESSLSIY